MKDKSVSIKAATVNPLQKQSDFPVSAIFQFCPYRAGILMFRRFFYA
ncbi:MAG: hypothetical protein AB7U05_11025 [Mangrovibacterium sp.]